MRLSPISMFPRANLRPSFTLYRLAVSLHRIYFRSKWRQLNIVLAISAALILSSFPSYAVVAGEGI